jgi:hypothetical protein
LAATDDNRSHLGHHCCQRASPISIKHRGRHQFIKAYFNLLNLLNRFDGGLGTNMRKAAHPSGGMGSSNPVLFVRFLTRDLSVVLVRTF